MAEYVAFLRGINLGGHNKINMADLRQAFAAWGFQNVRTVLATGNVLFETQLTDASGFVSTVQDKIQETFSIDASIILRTLPEIQDLVAAGPFKIVAVTPQTRLYVTFLSRKPNSGLKIPYESPEKDFQILRVSDGEVCSVLTLTPNSRRVAAMSVLEKEFGKNVTTRNWNTIIKIAGLGK